MPILAYKRHRQDAVVARKQSSLVPVFVGQAIKETSIMRGFFEQC